MLDALKGGADKEGYYPQDENGDTNGHAKNGNGEPVAAAPKPPRTSSRGRSSRSRPGLLGRLFTWWA